MPGQRDQPGRDAGLLELRVELLDQRGRALALALDRLDLRPQVEDPRLESVLLGLQLVGGLDQRRPLLGRVPDARPLGRELGGDEEAERQKGDAEGDLPARDRPDMAHHGHGASPLPPRRATRCQQPEPDQPDRDGDQSEDEPPGRPAVARRTRGCRCRRGRGRRAGCRRRARRGRSDRTAGRGPGPGGRDRAGRRRLRPVLRLGRGVDALEPGRAERGHVQSERRRERLVVGPAVRVRADQRRRGRRCRGSGPCSRPRRRSPSRPGRSRCRCGNWPVSPSSGISEPTFAASSTAARSDAP